MKGFDNGFKNAFVNSVCNHAYLRVLEDIAKTDSKDNMVFKCSHCNLFYNGNFCDRCEEGWCERDYYCKKPSNEHGVFDYCPNVCNACLPKCHVCKKAICFYENCCMSKGSICSDCRIMVCLIHTIIVKGVNCCEIHADERIKKL
jgi:hypothetical protein